jgi:hypothetical protein
MALFMLHPYFAFIKKKLVADTLLHQPFAGVNIIGVNQVKPGENCEGMQLMKSKKGLLRK